MPDHLKELAQTRLLFASEYIDDNQRLQDLIRPGRLIIVDLGATAKEIRRQLIQTIEPTTACAFSFTDH